MSAATAIAHNAVTRVLWYLGMGALAHWLWIGEHFDPQAMFTWVCVLLGPLMVLAWLVAKAGWVLLVLIVAGLIVGAVALLTDMAWRVRDRLR